MLGGGTRVGRAGYGRYLAVTWAVRYTELYSIVRTFLVSFSGRVLGTVLK